LRAACLPPPHRRALLRAIKRQGEPSVSSQNLPIIYTQSLQAVEVSTETPLIQAIQRLFKQQPGADLKSVIKLLMRASGALIGEVEDHLKAEILGNPKIGAALDRLVQLRLINRYAGKTDIDLARLSAVSEPTTLALEAQAGKSFSDDEAVIGITGSAELALVATINRKAEAEKLRIKISDDDILHSCRLGGNVGLKANAKTPLGRASATLAAAANAGLGITWHFQRHADDTVLNSLVYAALDVGQGACPWNLDHVMRVLDEPLVANGHIEAMKAIDLVAERSLGLSAGITLQQGFSKEFEVAGAGGKQAVSTPAEINASLTYSLRRRGRYAIRLYKKGGDVMLDLDTTAESGSTRAFDFGLDIGVSGVDALATGWINKLLPEPPEHYAGLIEKWSTPGTLLKAKLEGGLEKRFSKALQPLIPILLGDATADEVAKQQVSRLFAAWEEALNARIGLINTSAEAIVDQLMTSARETLGEHYALVEAQLGELSAAVADKVKALQDQLASEVDDVVATLKTKSQSVIRSALKPLELVGARVSELEKSLNTSAAPTAKAITDLLARYEKLRTALLDGAKLAAKLKLGVAFNDTLEKSAGESRLLILRFKRDSDSARRWFSDLVLGRVDIDIDAIRRAADTSDGAFAIVSGSFVAFAERARTSSLTLDVFGMPFRDVRMLSSDVRVEVDLSGRVSLRLNAQQSDTSKSRSEERVARFSADFSALSLPAELDQSTRGIAQLPGSFSLAFELTDNKLKGRELEEFFGGFVDVGVLPPSVITRARQLLGKSSDPAASSTNVQLSVVMTGLGRALQQAAREAASANAPAGALQRETLSMFLRHAKMDGWARNIVGKGAWQIVDGLVRARRPPDAKSLAYDLLTSNGGSVSGGNENKIALPLWRLILVMQTIPNAIIALGKIGALAAQLREEVVSNARASEARDLLDVLLAETNRALSPLIDARDISYSPFTERLRDSTVALLAVLSRLAGAEGLGATPVLRRFTIHENGERRLGVPVLIG